MAGIGACWVVHHLTALSDEINRAGDTIGVTSDGILCDPTLMIPAHRVTLQMNETIAQYHI